MKARKLGKAKPMIPQGGVVEHPNIVLIVMDDMDLRSMQEERPDLSGEVMMNTIDRTPIEWTQAVANNPLCAPSRATIWTGLRSINHGVMTNSGATAILNLNELLPVWMQAGGYKTALIGKSINGYESATPLPGWTHWFSMIQPDQYLDYQVSADGVIVEFGSELSDYSTDVLTREACSFAAESDEPWFMQLNYNAPHAVSGLVPIQAQPAARHRGLWSDEEIGHAPSFNEFDVSDKPAAIRALDLLTPQQIIHIEIGRKRRYETLLAADEGIESLFQVLGATGRLSHTAVIFTSDNGFQFGEHRLQSVKAQRYEESVRIPLRAHIPWILPQQRHEPVSNIDLAPTILDIAGLEGDRTFDGRSLFTSLPPRDGVHIERPGWVGFRRPDYKIIQEEGGFVELYNLGAPDDGCSPMDPFEETNVADLSCYRMLKQELLSEL